MIGRTVGHYRILRKLGAGGMGIVYEAEDLKLGRSVALKFLPARAGDDSAAKKRFIREAQAASALDHPNICTVFEVDETADGELFMAMALYKGQTLRERIARGPIPVADALEITAALSAGLTRAHEAGIIHRDIKPGNVGLTSDGIAKILDFGLAKLRGGSMITDANATLGTFAYMSPEQARGEDVDHRTDIWSLGVVLYEMLAGRRPFDAEYVQATMYMILNQEPEPLDSDAFPPELIRIVNRALCKDPSKRFQSMDELHRAVSDVRGELTGERVVPLRRRIRDLLSRPRVMIPVILAAILLAVLFTWSITRDDPVARAREVTIPEIMRLVEDERYFDAYRLAREVQPILPDDPVLAKLVSEMTLDRRIQAFTIDGSSVVAENLFEDPVEARLMIRPYLGGHDWLDVGTVSKEPVRLPKGMYAARLEVENHDPFDFAVPVADIFLVDSFAAVLPRSGTVPDSVVVWPFEGGLDPGISLYHYENRLDEASTGAFLVDKYEVTNRAFKHFVDQGGYARPEYWKHPFVDAERILTWEEAMARFVDESGRPGPATWQFGTLPEGQADYPVTGVSWYEAAAFAEFAGKRLPSVYHFSAMASWSADIVVQGSNFGSEGLAPVGSTPGALTFGTYDLAGNAREWMFNATDDGGRFTFGGAWDGPRTFFNEPYVRPPFDRDASNGFRCVMQFDSDRYPAELDEPLARRSVPDWRAVRPFSDDEYEAWQQFLAYPDRPLDERVEKIVETSPHWRMEKISFNAGYGNERMLAYLFLPRNAKPPYQLVLYWPGAWIVRATDSMDGESLAGPMARFGYFVLDGRAMVIPVLKGTFERGGIDRLPLDQVFETLASRDIIVQQIKDIRRTIDYLETREDVDAQRIAYVGWSYGAHMGGIACGAEPRFKAGIFISGSASTRDSYCWAKRATTPVLMLSGLYDSYFPFDETTLPYFEAFATPEKDKRLITYEGDHLLSGFRKEMIRDSLAWLDEYLGPVVKQ